jgi:P-type Mg2+ transporter
VVSALMTSANGLIAAEASRRLASVGPNAVRSHRAELLPVLLRQLRSPLLVLLAITAIASYFVGERTDALIIGVILMASFAWGA